MIKVVLVGSPNVGKSVIFNSLTGNYVTVSNYPGTTVEISRGRSKINGQIYEILDTPGMYSLISMTEEERVTRNLLCQEKPDIVVHVIDAKNIRRMLSMTLQLIDSGFPLILNLNLMDEAKDYGIAIKVMKLAEILGIPVIATSAIKKNGLDYLKQEIGSYQLKQPIIDIKYTNNIEQAIMRISSKLAGNYGLSLRMAALLLIQGDTMISDVVYGEEDCTEILTDIKDLASHYKHSMEYVLVLERQAIVDNICDRVLKHESRYGRTFVEMVGRITREPITGIPILCLVLYLGLYQFVGKFGAGFLVDYIDKNIFNQYINPVVEYTVYQYIPWEWLQSLIVGQYGVFTMGFRYSFVIILPIVGTFFFMFAILEDSGYLPRLAMLVDRIFKYLGLNGRAVIPFALGLGCGTMAVMVTRTLEKRRERILATFLLSLTIPCSAQLGVIFALLSHSSLLITIWGAYVGLVFIVTGWLSGKIIPGDPSPFYMELPPIRIPVLSNIINKAFIRMWWYFIEILPVFIITSIIMWWGDRSGVLLYIIKRVEPVMILLGLPIETAQAFLLGFFRRDYGAVGLYDMCANGSLNNGQLLIASVTLTLFVPCIAQVAVMVKERGLLLSLFMIIVIIFLALFAGWILHWLLNILPVSI